MVRWGPLSGDLPEGVLDFKRALRQAINNAGYRNLGDLTKATGIPHSTLSDAAGNSLLLPTEENLVKILKGSNSKAPSDGRYPDWNALFKTARAAAMVASARAHPRRDLRPTELPDDPVPSTAPPLPDHKPHLVMQDQVHGMSWYCYTEAATAQLIARYSPPATESPEVCDE